MRIRSGARFSVRAWTSVHATAQAKACASTLKRAPRGMRDSRLRGDIVIQHVPQTIAAYLFGRCLAICDMASPWKPASRIVSAARNYFGRPSLRMDGSLFGHNPVRPDVFEATRNCRLNHRGTHPRCKRETLRSKGLRGHGQSCSRSATSPAVGQPRTSMAQRHNGSRCQPGVSSHGPAFLAAGILRSLGSGRQATRTDCGLHRKQSSEGRFSIGTFPISVVKCLGGSRRTKVRNPLGRLLSSRGLKIPTGTLKRAPLRFGGSL